MADNLGAETLRAVRAKLELSQAGFGKLVKAHQSQVARWESGASPDAKKRIAMAAYGIGFDWWEQPPTKPAPKKPRARRVSSRDRLRTGIRADN